MRFNLIGSKKKKNQYDYNGFDGGTSKDVDAFCKAYNLDRSEITEFVLSDYIDVIDNYAFDGCDHLKSIVIPDGVHTIKLYAFANCKDLKTITLPASLMTIESSAFIDCISLDTVEFRGTPEQFKAIKILGGNNDFKLAEVEYV